MKKIVFLVGFIIAFQKFLYCEEVVFTNEEYKEKWFIVKLKNALDGDIDLFKDKNISENNEIILKLFYKLSDKSEYNMVDFRRKIDRNVDWKKMKAVKFSLYGNQDENVYLQVGFYTNSGSYFVTDIKEINWTGWKNFEIPKKNFYPVGSLCDWDDVDNFFIRVNGDVAASKGKINKEDSGEIYIGSIKIEY
ncbi:MAG: hypothetical protein NC926_01330 [Candidatus Omnitrophica bacterium]|nr:hypothetical protein [Candidatus Omnitrophota bacterium]